MSKAYTRIIGGKQAFQGEYPWQAALVWPDKSREIFCGGSLIKPSWVLTAAHCVLEEDGSLERFLVRCVREYGPCYPPGGPNVRKVRWVIVCRQSLQTMTPFNAKTIHFVDLLNPFTAKCGQRQNSTKKSQISICKILKN